MRSVTAATVESSFMAVDLYAHQNTTGVTRA